MKKSFFYLAVSAIALSACTSEDLIEDAAQTQIGKAISFETVVNKHSRADLTAKDMDHFSVFGYYVYPNNPDKALPIFEGTLVSRQPNGSWTYEGKQRSWIPGAKYYFFAYNCGNVEKLDSKYGSFKMDMQDKISPSDRLMKIEDYICDYTHQHDLVYAYATGENENDFAGIEGQDKGNQAVALQFKHLLSKVKAKFTTTFPSEYTVEISDVTIQNIRNKGTYSPNAGWQEVVREAHPYVYLLETRQADVDILTITADGKAAETNFAYVIPYSYNGNDATEDKESTWVYINFTIDVKANGASVISKTLTGKFNPSWTAGYQYTYNVEISAQSLEFDDITFKVTSVEEWLDGTDGTNTIEIDQEGNNENNEGNND